MGSNMESQEMLIKQLVDELFRDEENTFFEPYRDGLNYGVRKNFEEEISEKLGISKEDAHSYLQQILETTVQILNYIVVGDENKINALGDLEKYIYEKIPEKIKEYVLSRYILKRSMAGPVYHTIEITPVVKKVPGKDTQTRTFVIRVQLDREGIIFKGNNNAEPNLETIMFEATEHDLKEILKQIKEVIEYDDR